MGSMQGLLAGCALQPVSKNMVTGAVRQVLLMQLELRTAAAAWAAALSAFRSHHPFLQKNGNGNTGIQAAEWPPAGV
jgi:hypothetical protein